MTYIQNQVRGHTDQWNRIESLKIKPYIRGLLIFDKGTMTIINRAKNYIFSKCAGTKGCSDSKNEIELLPRGMCKNELKIDQRSQQKS